MKRDKALDALKWIAIITMTIDHVGYMFLPDIAELRIIGRIAFPLFAYLIAQGMRNTRAKAAYTKRLFIFALIAQIPFYFMFESAMLNVLFTFAAGAILCTVGPKFLLLYIPAMFIIPFEYSWWGMLLVPIFYYLHKSKKTAIIIAVASLGAFAYLENIMIQMAAVAAFFLIVKKDVLSSFNWPVPNKYFFYWFYPAHLAVLVMLNQFIQIFF